MADVCFWISSCSPSALPGLVSPSAIGRERCFVSSDSLMRPLWRLSCRSPGPKFSKRPRNGLNSTDRVIDWWYDVLMLYFIFPCRHYLKCYIFVSQLEALNIPYTAQSFLSSPKEGLVKGLWKNHRYFITENIKLFQLVTSLRYFTMSETLKHSLSFQVVRLVADLCLEYQVYDPQLWNSLLQKLLGFNLVRGRAPKLFLFTQLDSIAIQIL